MGGIGSGNWYRWNNKTTTGEVHQIDVRYLRKQNQLRPGCTGNLSWSQVDEQTGSIRFRVDDDCLNLMYRARSYGGDWQGIEETVWFDRTPCNYGGERLWLLCPHCSKRVAVLYGADTRFLCRHCYDLPYSSQQETYVDRMMRKARKIRDRLGASNNLTEPIWEKPKGMHWKTFERLEKLEREANQASTLAFWDKLRLYEQ